MSSIPGSSFPLALLYGTKEEFKQEGREKREQHKMILFLVFLPLFVG